MTAPTTNPRAASLRPTSLAAVLWLTFLSSIGSAVIYGGIFFLAKSHYGFTRKENYLLALLFGVTYIPAAYFAGAAQRLARRAGLSPRSLLMLLLGGIGAVCFVPVLIDRLAPHTASPAAWPIWAVIAVYAPLAGCMWPIIEAFLAGGRTERELRAATGRFNITWSGAIVVTFLSIAPLVEHHALLVLSAVGVAQAACVVVVACFQPEPAVHEHHEHHRPIVYSRLLTFLRMMLPVSFLFISTLTPYMPEALKSLAVPILWQTPVVAVWYFVRVLTFLAMERRHGWHGRWTVPVLGSVLLLVSFAWLILVPMLAPANLGLLLFLAGLVGFGAGVGIVYAAALYYAMEVGPSGVDAGGTHEALIGLGYASGPICLLSGVGVASGGPVHDESATFVTLAIVVTVSLAVGTLALYRAFRLTRSVN